MKTDSRSTSKTLALVGFLATSMLMLAACGSDSDSTTTTSTSAAAKTAVTTAAGGKPVVTVPATPAPTTLQVTDLVTGTGAEAKSGDNVTVQYVGVSYSTKKEFDASWNRGAPFQFALGQGGVIKGWDQGVVGMKVGGRRQLVIPPSLGYGAAGSPPVIAPNETLVFVVDLVSIP